MDIQWIAAQFPQLSGLQPLAQGGQKVVFAAQHASDGDVVLKLLLRASDEQRLEREVLAGQLVECEGAAAPRPAVPGAPGALRQRRPPRRGGVRLLGGRRSRRHREGGGQMTTPSELSSWFALATDTTRPLLERQMAASHVVAAADALAAAVRAEEKEQRERDGLPRLALLPAMTVERKS